jgi:hypothetical protein
MNVLLLEPLTLPQELGAGSSCGLWTVEVGEALVSIAGCASCLWTGG